MLEKARVFLATFEAASFAENLAVAVAVAVADTPQEFAEKLPSDAEVYAVFEFCCYVKVGVVNERAYASHWRGPHQETNQGTLLGFDSLQKKKPDLRLTPDCHVQLTVPLEELFDNLVKENRESSPFLKAKKWIYKSVDMLDEEYNSGLRERGDTHTRAV
ncbi:hypothetical protein PTKIN_Ptkin13bG0299200 [Pterospermum kingtungense]